VNTVVAIGSDENPPCATPALSSGARELNAAEESRIFWRLRRRLLWNVFRQGLARSRLRITLVVTLTAVLWGGLYFLFVGGFTFLRTAISDPGTHDQTVRAVYSVFFVSLTFMLVVSTGVILYGSLYRAREVRLLLTTPARAERVFAYKFHEAMLFSSWGFVLLGTPMLVAYGVVEAASWHYFVLLLPFLVAFVFIPGSIGAVLCLCVARHLPRNRQQVRWTAGGLAALVIVLLAWSLATGVAGEVLTPQWFQTVAIQRKPLPAQLVAQLRFTRGRPWTLVDQPRTRGVERERVVLRADAVQRPALAGSCRMDGQQALPRHLRRNAGRAHATVPRQALPDRSGFGSRHVLLVARSAAVARQGFPVVPPRPRAVVAVLDLSGAAFDLFPQHATLEL
jgi:Putative ATP-binding cassette